jgi:hypothetical protein
VPRIRSWSARNRPARPATRGFAKNCRLRFLRPLSGVVLRDAERESPGRFAGCLGTMKWARRQRSVKIVAPLIDRVSHRSPDIGCLSEAHGRFQTDFDLPDDSRLSVMGLSAD